MFSSEHVGEKLDFRQEMVRVEAKPPHRALLLREGTRFAFVTSAFFLILHMFMCERGSFTLFNLLAFYKKVALVFGTNHLSSIIQKLRPESLQRGQKEEVKGALKSLLFIVSLLSSSTKLWDTELMT